jgi:hypothetical protein
MPTVTHREPTESALLMTNLTKCFKNSFMLRPWPFVVVLATLIPPLDGSESS